MCPFSAASFHLVGKGGKEGEQEMTQGSREVQCFVNQEALGEVFDVVLEGWSWGWVPEALRCGLALPLVPWASDTACLGSVVVQILSLPP